MFTLNCPCPDFDANTLIIITVKQRNYFGGVEGWLISNPQRKECSLQQREQREIKQSSLR